MKPKLFILNILSLIFISSTVFSYEDFPTPYDTTYVDRHKNFSATNFLKIEKHKNLKLFHDKPKNNITFPQIKPTIVDFDPLTYRIILKGFSPLEKITATSIAGIGGHEILTQQFIYEKDFVLLVSPAVLNEKGGIAELRVTRQNGDKLTISLPWGSELKKLFYD